MLHTHTSPVRRSTLAVFGAIGLALVVTVTSQAASVVGHTNYLTFSGAVALAGHGASGWHLHLLDREPEHERKRGTGLESGRAYSVPRFHAARAAAGGTAEGPHGVTGRVEGGHVTADPRLVPQRLTERASVHLPVTAR